MGYISEDYCSEELSGMLMERGYIGAINTYLGKNDINVKQITLQSAMKWLREAHSLVIEPYRTACGYLYTVSNIPYGSTKYNNGYAYNGDDENSGQWTTWEKACEDAIKYCLENLI